MEEREMQKAVSIKLIILFFVYLHLVNFAFAECMDAEDFCRRYGDATCGRAKVIPNTNFPKWAGEIDQYCPNQRITDPRDQIVVVLVTWVTDISDYRCGQLIKKRVGDLKDFTHRSIKLKKCQ